MTTQRTLSNQSGASGATKRKHDGGAPSLMENYLGYKHRKVDEVGGGGTEKVVKKSRSSAANGRKLFLGHLRATCERWSSQVDLSFLSGLPAGQAEGLEVLRLFIRDILARPGMSASEAERNGKKFPLSECQCRHRSVGTPEGVDPCYTGGVRDAGKAQAFVMEDFRAALLKWLKGHQSTSIDLSDVEAVEIESDGESSQDEPEPTSSFQAADYSSTDFLAVGRKRRSTTKQRLTVLTYLSHHSDTLAEFKVAFKALCNSENSLLHLCGCGLSNETHPSSCVTGSHLKLESHDLNQDHTHLHFTLRLASTRDGYLKMLDSLRGSNGGLYDDVF